MQIQRTASVGEAALPHDLDMTFARGAAMGPEGREAYADGLKRLAGCRFAKRDS